MHLGGEQPLLEAFSTGLCSPGRGIPLSDIGPVQATGPHIRREPDTTCFVLFFIVLYSSKTKTFTFFLYQRDCKETVIIVCHRFLYIVN